MTATPRLPEGYTLTTDPSRIDTGRVHHWLSTDAYWALGRAPATQRAAIEGSLNFAVHEATTDEQVAYARVVTDRATFAWLCDVYVDPSVRGKGIGSALVAAAREELRSFGVRRVMLATHDAHAVYARLGFRPLDRPDQWMALALD
ncbi:GNAT family N-acetyltransferase [Streptomyces sp. NPDC029526]|uniref:GNAT family N-acetyltransferase n=1 Tax=Streptomyces sp. NPDC029526 TaxID=3155728 RepID=UPI00340BE345